MGARFYAPVQTGRGAHPASCTMRTGSFAGVKKRPGRDADHSPLLLSWSRKSTAIPLLPLWSPAALYPGERLRTHFTGGWVGPRAGLSSCGKSLLYRDSILLLSSPQPVVIPTELSRPTTSCKVRLKYLAFTNTNWNEIRIAC